MVGCTRGALGMCGDRTSCRGHATMSGDCDAAFQPARKAPSHKNRPLACYPFHSQIPEVLIQTTYAQESGQGASWALLT